MFQPDKSIRMHMLTATDMHASVRHAVEYSYTLHCIISQRTTELFRAAHWRTVSCETERQQATVRTPLRVIPFLPLCCFIDWATFLAAE